MVLGALRPSACLPDEVAWGLSGQVLGGVAGAVSVPQGGPADPRGHTPWYRCTTAFCRLSHGMMSPISVGARPSRSHVEFTGKGQMPSRFVLLRDAVTRASWPAAVPVPIEMDFCSATGDLALSMACPPQRLGQVNASPASG